MTTTPTGTEVRYLTVAAAAERTSLSQSFLRAALNAGQLAGFKIRGFNHSKGPGHWRINVDDLDQFMADLEADYERTLTA